MLVAALLLSTLPATPVIEAPLAFDDGGLRFIAQPIASAQDGRLRIRLQAEGRDPVEAEVGPHAIIEFEAPPTALDFARLGVAPGPRLLESVPMYQVRDAVSGLDGLALAARLRAQPGLVSVVPDLHLPFETRDFPVPPNDPRYPGQWYLERVDIESAWAISTGRPEITIAVLDNGCDPDHPDIPYSETRAGYDTVSDDDDPSHLPGVDGNNHGTACAGVIAATGNNGIGIAGACPECTIQCIRLLPGPDEFLPTSATVRAFDRVRAGGAAVASNSWGYVEIPAPGPVRTAIEALQRDGYEGKGALVVFAAGNDRMEIPPDDIAALPGVLTVSATNLFDELTSFSSFGPSVDLAAPGGTVTTDISGADGQDPGDYTSGFGGTSSACPLVAGVAGLLFSADPEATGPEVRQALVEAARPAPYAVPDDNGHDDNYGYGIVAPTPALHALLGTEPDAGVVDSGSPVDAGVADADAGVTDAGPLDEGGGCTSTPGDALAGLLLTLGAAVLARRRRAS